MTESGSLVSPGNGKVGRQTTKYHKDHDIRVKTWLLFCIITELQSVIPTTSFTNQENKTPKGMSNVQVNINSHEGLLWLFRTQQNQQTYFPLLQYLFIVPSTPFRMKGEERKPKKRVLTTPEQADRQILDQEVVINHLGV